MPDESLVEKMLHRMVKKHIAGTTMSAALSKVEELNSRKMLASVTFLSGDVENKSRARYITITYLELIRRVSRLGLTASVHIPLSQIGALIDSGAAAKNAGEIIATANRYGIFVWLEAEGPEILFADNFKNARGYGVAFAESSVKKFVPLLKKMKSVKVIFYEGREASSALNNGGIAPVLKDSRNLVLSSPPEKLIGGLSGKNKYKGSVVLEFRLGYSYKRLSKLMKKGVKVSVSVPFGKDWVNFAMNSVPEGYMRFLASNLLTEKHSTQA